MHRYIQVSSTAVTSLIKHIGTEKVFKFKVHLKCKTSGVFRK